MALTPAGLTFRDDGTPCSSLYGDVYHNAAGGLVQARKVFLSGNGLPERWQSRDQFVVLETGFGLGLNFLATWQAWQADKQRCRRLHFISTEKHPLSVDQLRQAHQHWPELDQFAAQLQQNWPALTPGFHRLEFAAGKVILTLCFGDTNDQLGQLDAKVDAIYLDGFTPARNPEMWSQPVFSHLARLADHGASLATWSVSGEVRRGLTQAGFECRKIVAPGAKPETLRGSISKSEQAARTVQSARKAIVLGAGLAGASIAERLAARDWQVCVIDSHPGPGMGASGNHAGVLRPLPSLDDNRLARLTRAGSLHARRLHQQMLDNGLPIRFGDCGVLHLARDPKHLARQKEVISRHAYPPDFAQFVDQLQASEIVGWSAPLGGWWFPRGGWVQPHSLCTSALAAHPDNITTHYQAHVTSLQRRDNAWHALDEQGNSIAHAPVVILANGVGISALAQASSLPIRCARGQVAHLPAPAQALPRTVVCRLGYVSPPVDGVLCTGASFVADDEDPSWRDSEHTDNLAKLDFILPGFSKSLPASPSQGRVGFRPASPDRLPMVGALPKTGHVPANGDTLADVPREPGLFAVAGFGARGLVWSAIVTEMLASQLNGDPLPLESDLRDAMDPARFLLRPKRQG